MGKRRKARILALQLLSQHDFGNRPLDETVREFWESQGHPAPDTREFAEGLAAGALKHSEELDALTLQHSSHWAPDRMAFVDRNILRLALYEIIHRSDIPPKVTINEFIEIAKKYSTKDSGAFVNGVLDSVLKERELQSVEKGEE